MKNQAVLSLSDHSVNKFLGLQAILEQENISHIAVGKKYSSCAI